MAVEAFLADVRYAVRQLGKAPAFTLASVLTLALGIGANTAVFSVVNAVILRPLPFPEPDRLVSVAARSTRGTPHPAPLSYPTFFDLRAANHVFEHLVSYRSTNLGLSGAGEPVSLPAEVVSWDLFDALGVRPALGRGFLPEEERAGQHVAILSHELWRGRFGSDRSLIGRSISINRQPYTVVGIAPPGFHFPIGGRPVEIWITPAIDEESDTVVPMTRQRGAGFLSAIARLRPGVAIERAQAETNRITANLARQYPDEMSTVAATYVQPETHALVGNARTSLLILLGAVGIVLLVACANVANLLLARTAERQHEFAVRASIGAAQARLIRQLLAESLTFALAGSAAGVLVAVACIRLLLPLVNAGIPRIEQASIDVRVLVFSVLLAVLTSALFSLAPALRLARTDLVKPLQQASRSSTGGNDGLRNSLVMAQVALGLMLLSAAGMLAAGFLHLVRQGAGFRPEGLVSFRMNLPDALQRGSKHLDFWARVIERLRALPGVHSAAAAFPLPLAGHQIRISFNIEERPSVPFARPSSDMAIITPGYFETLGVPVLEGRAFNERDDATSPPVIIINRAFADRYFPGENTLGKRIEPGATAKGVRTGMREIVGIVGNARQDPLGTAPDPIYYYALKQLPWCCPWVIVRTSGAPLALESALRSVLGSLDSQTPVYEVQTLEQRFSMGVAQPRFQTLLLGAFALIGLLLTAVGLYGILAYSVLCRTREIGVRVALGASPGMVAAAVMKEAMRLVAIGMAMGIIGAQAGNRVAAQMIYGAGPPQPLLIAAACLVIVLTAALAAYLPARRAASIDPMRALRSE